MYSKHQLAVAAASAQLQRPLPLAHLDTVQTSAIDLLFVVEQASAADIVLDGAPFERRVPGGAY